MLGLHQVFTLRYLCFWTCTGLWKVALFLHDLHETPLRNSDGTFPGIAPENYTQSKWTLFFYYMLRMVAMETHIIITILQGRAFDYLLEK